jgi:hypothetical protein
VTRSCLRPLLRSTKTVRIGFQSCSFLPLEHFTGTAEEQRSHVAPIIFLHIRA